MQLHLDQYGYIPDSFPRSFYRVSDWLTGLRVADFDDAAEAHRFAIEDAAAKGRRYDHRVSHMHMTGGGR